MSNIVIVSNDAHLQSLLAGAGDGPVLVDFFAEWCGPCKTMVPALQAYADAHPEVLVVKVDVDSVPDAAMSHGVRSIPTLELIQNGKSLGKRVGAQSAAQLKTFVDAALAA